MKQNNGVDFFLVLTLYISIKLMLTYQKKQFQKGKAKWVRNNNSMWSGWHDMGKTISLHSV